jgi:DNA-binding cell septation regulator SpoVG
MLKDEVSYYRAEQDAIVEGHLGEFVIIEDRKVVGYYKDIEAAIKATAGHELGKFMLSKCERKGEDIIHFYNRELRFA